MAYTIHDTPETNRRIDADLIEAIRVVRAGDPGLRSLVLTGGFARGEGAMLDGRPQNDYDLVAIRQAWRRPKVPYRTMQAELERTLGLHVDLAPVPAWRLRRVAPSIFWYETAQRGRVLWGEHLLHRVPLHSHRQLGRTEALRLVVNRAAGLLLVTPSTDAHARRLQAAKAILAAADAHLLAAGEFAPSQTERWHRVRALQAAGTAPAALGALGDWLPWAYTFKVDPGAAAPVDAAAAWRAARHAVLEAVPVALAHAGLPSLEAYARKDGLADHVAYALRSAHARRAGHVRPRVARNPTGRVRCATIQALDASPDGVVPRGVLATALGRMAGRRAQEEPVAALDAARKATLQ